MNLHEALAELVVFGRESGGDESPHLRAALHVVEEKALRMRTRHLRRRRCDRCKRCEQRRSDGLLCWACQADAPLKVQMAFQMATGLPGMRSATRLVIAWARGEAVNESEAA